MDEPQKTELRQQIEQEIADGHRAIARLEESSAPVAPDKALGRLTRMESLNDQGVSGAALNRKREKRYRLELALEALDQPGFGRCVTCGRPIPIERLLALPESTRCAGCAGR